MVTTTPEWTLLWTCTRGCQDTRDWRRQSPTDAETSMVRWLFVKDAVVSTSNAIKSVCKTGKSVNYDANENGDQLDPDHTSKNIMAVTSICSAKTIFANMLHEVCLMLVQINFEKVWKIQGEKPQRWLRMSLKYYKSYYASWFFCNERHSCEMVWSDSCNVINLAKLWPQCY